MKRVLITGGAGFIGSHVADQLLARGCAVRALDALDPQVHGPERRWPDYLAPGVERLRGDVRDRADVARALEGADAVLHLAAAVGVGQSMYEVERYTSVNSLGTAALLEALIERDPPLRRLVVASSMSVYGEGRYAGGAGEWPRALRPRERLSRRQWEPVDERGRLLRPLPTPEEKPVDLASVYALSKYDQERLSLMLGEAYGIPTVALRFFNVYGPRQAVSNPYTGVLAIFASRYLNDRPPVIFEDGAQLRDFVSVHDVARACVLALEREDVAGEVFNIGSGQPRTVSEVAQAMARLLGKQHLAPELPGRFRVGDIRHCYADIGKARRRLGYEPRERFEEGLRELVGWLRGQPATDHVAEAHEELAARGLTIGG